MNELIYAYELSTSLEAIGTSNRSEALRFMKEHPGCDITIMLYGGKHDTYRKERAKYDVELRFIWKCKNREGWRNASHWLL